MNYSVTAIREMQGYCLATYSDHTRLIIGKDDAIRLSVYMERYHVWSTDKDYGLVKALTPCDAREAVMERENCGPVNVEYA